MQAREVWGACLWGQESRAHGTPQAAGFHSPAFQDRELTTF